MIRRKDTIEWDDFAKIDLRVGTIVKAELFPEARNPAIKVWVDFGIPIGTLKSSAQITDLYSPEALLGRQVVGVTNFAPKQIGPFMSECLITGVVGESQGVVLLTPDREVQNGGSIA